MNDVMEANSSKCLQDQKMLLLQLKNNLTYDSEISLHLAYWDDTIDFCEWKGVTFNDVGQVIGLDLNHEWLSALATNKLENIFYIFGWCTTQLVHPRLRCFYRDQDWSLQTYLTILTLFRDHDTLDSPGKRIDVRNSGLSPMKPLEFVSSQVSEFGLEIEQVSSV
ncbi:hypothetical protein FXO38_30236 [Capsicum annuum]|nr:hypothetical protein FXO38_30236 [Capsicum annuum]KAF3685229.1 hypothetical protein FXO37_00828 [Capsicum annuum]